MRRSRRRMAGPISAPRRRASPSRPFPARGTWASWPSRRTAGRRLRGPIRTAAAVPRGLRAVRSRRGHRQEILGGSGRSQPARPLPFSHLPSTSPPPFDFLGPFGRDSRPMKTKLGGIVIGLLVSLTALAGPTREYDETTTVAGKVPVDLRGVWLLVAQPEVAKGKFKTFPELLMISQQKDGRPSFHLLDVRLPADMTGEVK